MSYLVLIGDWLEQMPLIPSESIHCICTSPPYWGLRDYELPPVDWPKVTFKPMPGCASITVEPWRGCLGLEPTPEMFVAHMVHGFREVRRILRKDGTIFLNFGDSYATFAGKVGPRPRPEMVGRHFGGHREGSLMAMKGQTQPNRMPIPGLKPKDLVGIPWRVAFALQADGYHLRSDIIWAKPNPMPESVIDRPAKSHEYIFLLSKSEQYYFDLEAVKEQVTGNAHARGSGVNPKARLSSPGTKQNESFSAAMAGGLSVTRNSRTVWTMKTEPFKGSHFATFPTALPRRAFMAGTSAYGCCVDCGAPWERVVFKYGGTIGKSWHGHQNDAVRGNTIANQDLHQGRKGNEPYQAITVGWQPTCECRGKLVLETVIIPARITSEQAEMWGADANGEYHGKSTKGHSAKGIQDASAIKKRILQNATTDREAKRWVYKSDLPLDKHPVKRCNVMDIFAGTGTSGQVAIELGLDCVLIEANPANQPFLDKRTKGVTPGLSLA